MVGLWWQLGSWTPTWFLVAAWATEVFEEHLTQKMNHSLSQYLVARSQGDHAVSSMTKGRTCEGSRPLYTTLPPVPFFINYSIVCSVITPDSPFIANSWSIFLFPLRSSSRCIVVLQSTFRAYITETTHRIMH